MKIQFTNHSQFPQIDYPSTLHSVKSNPVVGKLSILLMAISFCLLINPIFSAPMYVQSPVAQLLEKPQAGSTGSMLPKGSVVQKIGEQDMFIKVSYEGKEGFVNKLFLSANPPSAKVSFGDSIDQSTSVKARARASSFTQTAAARGFSESQTLRTRGGAGDYDMDSIEWLEKLKVDENEVQSFQK